MSDLVFRALGRASRGFAILVLSFLILPILAVIPLSFTAGAELIYPLPGWSLRWYADFFSRSEWLLSAWNSLTIGIGTTVLATALGTAAALGTRHLSPRSQSLVAAILLVPMAVPVIIVAVAMFFFYAKLGIVGSYVGLVLGHTTIALPFVFVSVRASLSGLGPEYERAALSLGAPPSRVFRRVVAPMIAPGIASGALFAFATSLDDVVIAMFVSGPQQLTLPRQMFAGVRENISPTILAAATMLVALSMLLMVANGVLTRRSQKLTGAVA